MGDLNYINCAASVSFAESDEKAAARAEFERQHEGRDLSRHHLRGTYVSGPIAALWNQHLRTIEWLRRAVPQANAEQDARRVGTLYAAIQKAAGELPEGYTIKIEVERDAGWVEWAGPDCEWKLSDGNDGYMCQAVEEAIDAAIRAASNATSGAIMAARLEELSHLAGGRD